ncbi:MAG: protein-L-isoaspartate(D-aspartate) O-methyltransferase [Sphaerochaetaceae bacterium]|jgi:protein-L-isoaspartate(D-aspartate) O-methyltransferase|nr:protein-L-isoaspartate(D-aspartate) O-methyltransferase [Sphaerochaetaceae bacterium]
MDMRTRITRYYKELDRSYFMDRYKEQAHEDTPLPIGHGQTISQPSLVLEMTILLDVNEESNVLEIGTGSGYQTALLAKASQMVYTVERIEELHVKAIERLNRAGYTNIKFKLDDGSLGWQEYAPYDRIMVTAAASRIPNSLIEQLAPNGKMLIPVGSDFMQDLLVITKDNEGNVAKQFITNVRFVPLVGDY